MTDQNSKNFTEQLRDTQYNVSPIPFHTHNGIDSPVLTGSPGIGSVTSVSVVTANGISGTVATPTTTPAITLMLGNITPTSIVATGSIESKTSFILEETGAGTDTITLQAPVSIASSYTLTLPVDDGTLNQVLTTNGSGVLSWTTSGGGGSPGGNDTNVQYNNMGAFAGDDSFDFVVADFDFGLPKITLGNSTGGGIISGGDYSGGGADIFRITTNSDASAGVLTRNLNLTTGDTGGTGSVSGSIYIASGYADDSSGGVAGTIQIQTGDSTGTANGASIILRGGDVSVGGNATEITGNTNINGGITNPAQTYSPSAATTATLDLSRSNQHYITMPAGNITIALSNSTLYQNFLISITQDSTGSRTVTWFTTIRWTGGSPPTLTTTANKRDYFGLIRTGSGTYDGFVVGQNI